MSADKGVLEMGDKSFKGQAKPLLNKTVQGNVKQVVPVPSMLGQARFEIDISFIEDLIAAEDVAEIADAIPRPGDGGIPTDLSTLPGSTPDRGGAGRRIGGVSAGTGANNNDGMGFDDPLAAHYNRRGGSRGSLVGPGSIPTGNELAGQQYPETNTPATTDLQSGDGPEGGTLKRPSSVHVVRQTERTSPNGVDTWGSTLYRDDSGSHWRSDDHTRRGEDGSVTTTNTVYDGRGEAIKTTVVVMSPYGVRMETTTNHRTGETRTVDITPKEEPEPTPEAPEKYQPADGPSQGDPIAPRGWSNPVTGAVHNPGLKTGNNQVNPGPEPSQPPLKPLRLDPRVVVINPSPDAQLGGDATPRDIRREEDDINIIDPPRPTA